MSDTNKEREAAIQLAKQVGAIIDIKLGAPYDVIHITPSQLAEFAIRARTEPSAQVQGETPAPLRGEWESVVAEADRRYPRSEKMVEAFLQGAKFAAPMPQSAGVTEEVISDGAYLQMARKAGATIHETVAGFGPPRFDSFGEWGRFCDAVRAAYPVLALSPGLSGWQEIASDADRIAAWLLTQVQGGYSLMNRLYNEPPNVADSVAAGAWIQTVTQHLHCLAANATPLAPGIAPHQPQPDQIDQKSGRVWNDDMQRAWEEGREFGRSDTVAIAAQPQPEPQEAAEEEVVIVRSGNFPPGWDK